MRRLLQATQVLRTHASNPQRIERATVLTQTPSSLAEGAPPAHALVGKVGGWVAGVALCLLREEDPHSR